MKQGGTIKVVGAGVLFVLLTATIGSYGVPIHRSTPQPLGVLAFDPTSHDFGNMSEGDINTTEFQIWTTGGCCELTFNLTWNSTWISVFPVSGVSNGEKVNITVTVNATGLSPGMYQDGILITTNDCGTGVFNVTLNIVRHDTPWLSLYPQTCYFGKIPQNTIQTTTFDVWNSGTGTVVYAISSDNNWITASPQSGSTDGEHQTITVTIDTTGMTTGLTYNTCVHINSNGGNKIFYVWFIIGTTPKIDINTVTGGLYRVAAILTNTGTADAIGVDWKITIGGNGLTILGKETKGKMLMVPAGGQRMVTSNVVLGLGKVVITVTAQNSEAVPISKQSNAQLILFYIKM